MASRVFPTLFLKEAILKPQTRPTEETKLTIKDRTDAFFLMFDINFLSRKTGIDIQTIRSQKSRGKISADCLMKYLSIKEVKASGITKEMLRPDIKCWYGGRIKVVKSKLKPDKIVIDKSKTDRVKIAEVTNRFFDQFTASFLESKTGRSRIAIGQQKFKGIISTAIDADLYCLIAEVKDAGFTRDMLRPDVISWGD